MLRVLPGVVGMTQGARVVSARSVQLGIQFEIPRDEILYLYEGVFALLRHRIGPDVVHEAGEHPGVAPPDPLAEHVHDGRARLVQDRIDSPVLAHV